jgi:hypothetical protein
VAQLTSKRKKKAGLLIVGGFLEKDTLCRWLPEFKIVVVKGMNANSTLESIFKRSMAMVASRPTRPNFVCVVLDREDNAKNCVDIELSICDYLTKNAPAIRWQVVCPDQMIENWMLADVESWAKSKFVKPSISQRNWEGTHGKKEIGKLLQVDYNRPLGTKILNCIRDIEAQKHSRSFKNFLGYSRSV